MGIFLTKTATDTVNGGANFYFATTNNKNITLTASAAFSVLLSDETELQAELDGDVYTVAVPSAEKLYFRITSETSQVITFKQTFNKGTKVYPYEVTFTEGTATLEVSGVETYIKLPAGKYIASTSVYGGVFYLNGEQAIDGIFTVAEGDIIQYYLRRGIGSTLTFKYAVEKTYCGNYATVDSKKVSIKETSFLTYDGTAYYITAVSGDTYTYSDGTNTLTVVYGDTITVNGNALTAYVMFTEAQAGTYTSVGTYSGTDYDLTLVINKNGTAVYSYVDPGSGQTVDFDVDITETDVEGSKKYSFEYDLEGNGTMYKVEFSFNEDGTLALTDEGYDSVTPFNKLAVATFTEVQAGTYSGTYSSRYDSYDFIITLNADGTAVYDIVYYGQSYGPFEVTVMAGANGMYSFKYTLEGTPCSAEFTFNEAGGITLTDINIGEAVDLAKELDISTLTAYTGTLTDPNDTSYTVNLYLTEDKTRVVYTYCDVTISAEETSVFNSVAVTANGDGSYSFSFVDGAFTTNVKFTISGDTITVEDDFCGNGTLTKQA